MLILLEKEIQTMLFDMTNNNTSEIIILHLFLCESFMKYCYYFNMC